MQGEEHFASSDYGIALRREELSLEDTDGDPSALSWLAMSRFLHSVASLDDDLAIAERAVRFAMERLGVATAGVVQENVAGADPILAVQTSVPDLARPSVLTGLASGTLDPVEFSGEPTVHVARAEQVGISLIALRPSASLLPRERIELDAVLLATSLAIEAARHRRNAQQLQARNDELNASLADGHSLMERLGRIQRASSGYTTDAEVFAAISEAAMELTGDDLATVRLVDPHDPAYSIQVAEVGVDQRLTEEVLRYRNDTGVNARSVREDRLVIENDYGTTPINTVAAYAERGLRTAMAAPIRIDGTVVGSLCVASFRARSPYSDSEGAALLAFADHAGVALGRSRALTALRLAYEDARHGALHDELTGLPNRSFLISRINELQHAEERAIFTVLFVDLDDFKMVNDSLGHSMGDVLLREVATRLRCAIGPNAMVSRLGGDEFAVVAPDVATETDATTLALAIRSALVSPIAVGSRSLLIDVSIGVTLVDPRTPCDVTTVLRHADLAMYRAKADGKGRHALFESDMRDDALRQMEFAQMLRAALANNEMRVRYQPVIDLTYGTVTGFEALVRWQHPNEGLIGPSEFIAIAERSGSIVDLGAWVLEEACRQVRSWQHAPDGAGLSLSVNLSGRQLLESGLVEMVDSVLSRTGFAPNLLTLEITETYLMQPSATIRTRLTELRALGVRIAIDDFGTGYASLSYLREFPIDQCKIDRSYTAGLGLPGQDDVLASSIIDLSRTLGLEVVAEGIEVEHQLRRLRELGCKYGQGYLFAKPLSADKCEELLLTGASSNSFMSLHGIWDQQRLW